MTSAVVRMITRDQIRLIGKAMGWTEYPDDSVEPSHWWFTSDKAPLGPRIAQVNWNPFWKSGDALAVAAALKMNIDYSSERVFAQHRTADGFWINSPAISLKGRDPEEAYREAICLCAVKVGERMQ